MRLLTKISWIFPDAHEIGSGLLLDVFEGATRRVFVIFFVQSIPSWE